MPLQCGLKHSPCSTEWIDVYYRHTCGNIIILSRGMNGSIILLWNHSFPLISMRDTKSMPIGNDQLSKTSYKSCLLYYMVTSIEQKVFTFKHGLNIGRSIYRYSLLIFRLQAQCQQKFVLQALLTSIRLAMRCVICGLMTIIWV